MSDLSVRDYKGIIGDPNYTDDPKFMEKEVEGTVKASQYATKYVVNRPPVGKAQKHKIGKAKARHRKRMEMKKK